MLLVCLPMTAQDPDMHFASDPASALYRHSAFLHGYAHGYEMGFHSGDIDLHLGRAAREAKVFKKFKEAKKFYRKDFGSRDAFTEGYQQGFRVGYGDAYMGRNFRAAHEVRSIQQQLRDGGDFEPKPNEVFDRAVQQGYKAGMTAGLGDARKNAAFREGAGPCPGKKDEAYCMAHGLGYELGYSDGYNNQRKPSDEINTASD